MIDSDIYKSLRNVPISAMELAVKLLRKKSTGNCCATNWQVLILKLSNKMSCRSSMVMIAANWTFGQTIIFATGK